MRDDQTQHGAGLYLSNLLDEMLVSLLREPTFSRGSLVEDAFLREPD